MLDSLSSTTSLDNKGKCHHLHEYSALNRLIGHASASFLNLVQIGEHIEDGIKTGKIKIIRRSSINLPMGQVAPRRRNFPIIGMIKTRRKSINLQTYLSVSTLICSACTHLSIDSATTATSSITNLVSTSSHLPSPQQYPTSCPNVNHHLNHR